METMSLFRMSNQGIFIGMDAARRRERAEGEELLDGNIRTTSSERETEMRI